MKKNNPLPAPSAVNNDPGEPPSGRLGRPPPGILRPHSPATVLSALQAVGRSLALTSETPSLDAQVLLAHLLAVPRSWVLAHPEAPLSPVSLQLLKDLLARLLAGEPLPYVIGHWEFCRLDFSLSPQVLIPRPETELLVEQALAWLIAHPRRRRLVDVGTGSGCIAVSLAVNCPHLSVLATDCSLSALQVARRNAQRHRLADRIHFLCADLLAPFSALPHSPPFDLLCANLPYIPSENLPALPVFYREPPLALDGGPGGLHLIRRLLLQAPPLLTPGGLLLLEVDISHAASARDLALQVFPVAAVEILEDLSGRPRLLQVQLLN